MNVEDIKNKDEDYFKWAWANVGGLSELLFVRKYDVSLQDLLKTKKQIKEALTFTSDDWIKSPVKNNYDFILDQYKYACCAKQKDIATAVKEIEEYYEQSKTVI